VLHDSTTVPSARNSREHAYSSHGLCVEASIAAPGAYTNEIGAAAISTDEIDPLDIFGEPTHATEGAQEVYGWQR
jgi:hypothetical protein